MVREKGEILVRQKKSFGEQEEAFCAAFVSSQSDIKDTKCNDSSICSKIHKHKAEAGTRARSQDGNMSPASV